MKRKFTQGPWSIKHDFNVMGHGNDGIYRSICSTGGYDSNIVDPTEENIANANLIYSAPELLKQLEEHCRCCGHNGHSKDMCPICPTNDAIKKAYGEKP